MGIAEDSLSRYASDLFEGMNRQAFNTPIDLFIEQKLYIDFPTLRPCQFLSLYQLMNENVKAVTDKKIVELTPKDILSKSRTFNLIYALQFRDLYGLDMVEDLKATPGEQKEAIRLYEEYLEYKDDRAPGEEYELVKHWAEDLKLDDNFELIDEETYRARRSDPTGILESIEKDPLGLESTDPEKEREMKKFQDKQKEMGTNMAVVMYMVDALKYFEGMAKEEIRSIAMEIALQGTQGYRPEKEDYRISKIPGKLFSGYHILAYYYVSWKIAIPEMLSQLQLPFDEEYQLALSLYNSEKK
jgi:hypothetical protein